MITKTAILKNVAGGKIYKSLAHALADVKSTLTEHHFKAVKKLKNEVTRANRKRKTAVKSLISNLSPGKS